MNAFRATLACAVGVLLAATGARADESAPRGDLARFQGGWTAQVGPNDDIKLVLTFKDHAVDLAVALPDGQEFKVKGEVKLDETAKPLKTIDWINFKGPDGDAVADNLGIYEFDGEALKVCSGGPGKERPTAFKGGEDGMPSLITLTRVGPKAAATTAAPKGDLARFQGRWTTTIGPQNDIPLTLVVKDQKVSATGSRNGEDFTIEGEIILDEAAKPHKTLDWIKFVGPNGNEIPMNQGIYAIEGESIKICNGGPGNARPSEFKAGEDGPPTLIVLKRAKD